MEVLLLTEPKHPPRSGPPSARYETGRGNLLAEALLSAGHQPVMWWDHPVGPRVTSEPDLVLLRSGRPIQLRRAEDLSAAGLAVLNDPHAHRRASDKLHQAAIFASAGVPHPATYGIGLGLGGSSELLVAKPRSGSSGRGVRLLGPEDLAEALAVGDVVQEQVVGAPEYRVLVVGGIDVDWARKYPAAGDFRANLDQGGTMHRTERPSEQAAQIAVQAMVALGLDIGGVDLMVGRSGPVVLEVNAATTLHGSDPAATEEILRAVLGLCVTTVTQR